MNFVTAAPIVAPRNHKVPIVRHGHATPILRSRVGSMNHELCRPSRSVGVVNTSVDVVVAAAIVVPSHDVPPRRVHRDRAAGFRADELIRPR